MSANNDSGPNANDSCEVSFKAAQSTDDSFEVSFKMNTTTTQVSCTAETSREETEMLKALQEAEQGVKEEEEHIHSLTQDVEREDLDGLVSPDTQQVITFYCCLY
jgi:hypothetical protein